MHRYGFDGLLPKILSPTHLVKKITGGGHKAAAVTEPLVTEPAPEVSAEANGKVILLALGAGMLAIAFLGSRTR